MVQPLECDGAIQCALRVLGRALKAFFVPEPIFNRALKAEQLGDVVMRRHLNELGVRIFRQDLPAASIVPHIRFMVNFVDG